MTDDLLLELVASFLDASAISLRVDEATRFRLRIASAVVRSEAVDARSRDAREPARLAALLALLPDVGAGDEPDAAPGAAIERLEAELARRIRDGRGAGAYLPAVTAYVRGALAERLAIVNPQFDLSEEIDR